MIKKILNIIVCMLVIIGGFFPILIINNEVKADIGGSGPADIGLNVTYLWETITWLSNVVHDSYENGELRKGRFYGSKGDQDTADYLFRQLRDNCSFGTDNVTYAPLGPIDDYPNRNYTDFIDILDANFSIQNQSKTTVIPKNDFYPLASTWDIDPNEIKCFDLNDSRILSYKTFTSIFPKWETGIAPLNLTYELVNSTFDEIIGNLTYIPEEDPLPQNQSFDTIFLIDEVEGCDNKLENVTNASGVILIHNSSTGYTSQKAATCDFAIARIDSTDSNLTTIKQLLENNTVVLTDNDIYDSKLTFAYNFSSPLCYPGFKFCVFFNWTTPDKTKYNHKDNADTLYIIKFCKRLNRRDKLPFHHRYPSIILYDGYNSVTHNMFTQNINWFRLGTFSPMFALPGVSINRTLGSMLHALDGQSGATISGYILEKYCHENHDTGTPAGNVSNVVGYLNISDDPEDPVVVISNRYDGMWGECPGDSGAGTGIILGIARYFRDHDIIPKYNLRFLFTTGEETGYRGAQHYSDSHEDDPIIYWIGVDQLGFTSDNEKYDVYLENICTQRNDKRICDTIVKDTNYYARTGYENITEYKSYPITKPMGVGAEDVVFAQRPLLNPCSTILIHKAGDQGKNLLWFDHHRRGANLTKGDVLADIDENDVETFFELTWNITKYYCVDPDCWFNGAVTYTAVDSPYDPDPYNDSINATFSVQSILPHDKVRVKANLNSWPSNETILWKNFDFNVTDEGFEKTITVTLPPSTTGVTVGNYRLFLELYNSTERVNEITFILGGDENDTDLQTSHPYLHPRGNTDPNKPVDITGPTLLRVLETGIFTSNTTDVNNDHMQFHWQWNGILDFSRIGPYASGENCSKEHRFLGRGSKTIRVRAREDYYGYLFDGPLGLFTNLNRWGDWSEWSKPFEVMVRYITGFDLSTTCLSSSMNVWSASSLPSILDIPSAYAGFAFGGTEPSSYTWYFDYGECYSEEKTTEYAFSTLGNGSVVLNVSDDEGYCEEIAVNVSVVNISASYNLSIPSLFAEAGETIVFNDSSAVVDDYYLINWTWDFDDGTICYDRNTSHMYETLGVYNVTLTVRDNASRSDTYYKVIVVEYDDTPPELSYVTNSPSIAGFGFEVMIAVDVTDDISSVESVHINITYPDNSSMNDTMTRVVNDTYLYVFNNTWQPGVYNYSIWVRDFANNTNCTSGFNFTVAGDVNMSICTTQDLYGPGEDINLTDPPMMAPLPIGYELLDNDTVLHVWNQYDNYYFDADSGIQLTNHKDQYWSKNVLMLGYYNNDQWNLIYRADELTGFNREIETDNLSFVNLTLSKDLSYQGYEFRLALRYHLGVDDTDLTIIPYIKNTGATVIPYVLGFGWELKDIQINMTTAGDYIVVDQESFYLNQTLDTSYTNLVDSVFYLMENITNVRTQSLFLRWNPDLSYKLLVKSQAGQTNAPVTLFVRVGMLSAGQQKSTQLHWYDASQTTFYFNEFDENEAWENEPELMADGDDETFSSTPLASDVELLNQNTCESDDLGTILKVELRARCYYEGENPGNITLRPVFKDGEVDGENYTFTPGGEGGEPAWSPWSDITYDEDRNQAGGGQWSWSEINDLDCDVESSSEMEDSIVFCSLVQLRVTYNNAPTVSNPYPSFGSNGVSLQPMLNITVADPDNDVMNVTWYTNVTPSYLTLHPNANGSITQLSRYPSSTPANYMCVDESVANDSDYVHWTGTTWKKDTYHLQNPGIAPGSDIHGITVYARCCRGTLGQSSVNNSGNITIKSNGYYYYGGAFALQTIFSTYSHTWPVNPATGTAWTWGALDTLEAGVSLIGNQGASKCSQMYVVVNYTDPSSWEVFGSNMSVGDGTYHQQFLNASVNGQWWYWKVNADDGNASAWSSVYKFYTGYQSKIENTGETNISGYLLMQTQYLDGETWVVDSDVVNETIPRTILVGEQLGLDTLFNGLVNTNDLTYGDGLYRVYVAFRDPNGNILMTSDEQEMTAGYEFEVAGL